MSYPNQEMRCEQCRCWRRNSAKFLAGTESSTEYGICHRFPPTSDKTVETHETWFCFEFFPDYELKSYTY